MICRMKLVSPLRTVSGQEGFSLAECFFTLHYEPLDLSDVPRPKYPDDLKDFTPKYGPKYPELCKQQGESLSDHVVNPIITYMI